MNRGVLSSTLKVNAIVQCGFVRAHRGLRNFASRSRVSRACWSCFSILGTLSMKNLYHLVKRVNAEYYEAVLDCLLKRMAHVRLELYKSSDWFLLHNKAHSHNAALFSEFLAKKKITILHHSPISLTWLRLTIFCSPISNVIWKGSILMILPTFKKM